jgi:histidine triad (HIT) family protein
MNTIFTKIINREIPAQFVYEDAVCVVIMDKFPVVTGQVLIIPKLKSTTSSILDDSDLTAPVRCNEKNNEGT